MSHRVETVLYPDVPERRVPGSQDRGARAAGGVGGDGGRLPWRDPVQHVQPDPTVPAVPIRYEKLIKSWTDSQVRRRLCHDSFSLL